MHENDETMNANDETNKGCVGIWGWNTIPMLSLLAIVGWTLYTVATQHFPAFVAGLDCVITRHFGMEVSAKEVQEDEDGAEMELEVIEQREYVPENE